MPFTIHSFLPIFFTCWCLSGSFLYTFFVIIFFSLSLFICCYSGVKRNLCIIERIQYKKKICWNIDIRQRHRLALVAYTKKPSYKIDSLLHLLQNEMYIVRLLSLNGIWFSIEFTFAVAFSLVFFMLDIMLVLSLFRWDVPMYNTKLKNRKNRKNMI